MVQAVKSLFRPKSYQVVAFEPGQSLQFPSLAQISAKSRAEKTLSNSFHLQYFNVLERENNNVIETLELPKYIEPKVLVAASLSVLMPAVINTTVILLITSSLSMAMRLSDGISWTFFLYMQLIMPAS